MSFIPTLLSERGKIQHAIEKVRYTFLRRISSSSVRRDAMPIRNLHTFIMFFLFAYAYQIWSAGVASLVPTTGRDFKVQKIGKHLKKPWPLGVCCDRWVAGAWSQCMWQIWSACLHPFQRQDEVAKFQKATGHAALRTFVIMPSMVSRCTNFDVSSSTHYKAGEDDQKFRKWGGLGCYGSLKIYWKCKYHSI